MNGSYVLPQVVSAAGSVRAQGANVGLLPCVCLEVVTQVLAAVSALEDLTAHGAPQGRGGHGLERKYSHPSGHRLPLQDNTAINNKDNWCCARLTQAPSPLFAYLSGWGDAHWAMSVPLHVIQERQANFRGEVGSMI